MMVMDDHIALGAEKETEFLRTRELLKERIRKNSKQFNNDINKKLPSDNYGSFFGPSLPSIAPRVIEESKHVEFQNATTKFLNSHNLLDAKKRTSMNAGGTNKKPAALNEPVQKAKVETLRESRDYSFLFSDDNAAANKHPRDDQTSQAVLSGGKQAMVPPKTEESKNNEVVDGNKQGSSSEDNVSKQLQPKPANHAKVLGKKRIRCDESKKEITKACVVVVPKQPKERKRGNEISKKEISKSSSVVVSKQPPATTDHSKQGIIQAVKQKTQPQIVGTAPAAAPKQQPKVMIKYPSNSSKMKGQKKQPVREDILDEPCDLEYSSVIKKTYKYDRSKYGNDDGDCVVETSFADQQKEEKRRLGKKEDEEDHRLTEDMERKEKKLKQEAKRSGL